MTNETTKSRPTHRIYAVTKNGRKKFWQPIGAHLGARRRQGLQPALDYLPLNDAEIVVREISDQPQTEGNGAAQ